MNCLQCGKRMNGSIVGLYHYKESGLSNVYLKDSVTVFKCACGEKLVEIPKIERLQDAIAYKLLTKKALIIGAEFRFLRKWIGLTAEKLASALGQKTRISVSRWENGKAPITAATDHAMRLLVMRIKEQTIDQRMLNEIDIQDYFENIRSKQKTQQRITIDENTIRSLPFPASSSARPQHSHV